MRYAPAAAAVLAALVGAAAEAAEPIRIGSFLAVTGPAAFLGEPEKTWASPRRRLWNSTSGA